MSMQTPEESAVPEEHEDALEPFRHIPVGTNDPNIVGDVGPYDTPPGSESHDDAEFEDEQS